MNPLTRLLGAVADRLCAGQDAVDGALGLVVEYRPDGTRIVYLPDLPRIAAAYRARVLAAPDPVDRALITPAVRALAAREAGHPATSTPDRASAYVAAYLTKDPGTPPTDHGDLLHPRLLARPVPAPDLVPTARARPLRPARR